MRSAIADYRKYEVRQFVAVIILNISTHHDILLTGVLLTVSLSRTL